MKPENVLLDEHMRVKITDFGTAKLFPTEGKPDGQFVEIMSPSTIVADPVMYAL